MLKDMFKRNHHHEPDARLDLLGREIVRASGSNDTEAEAVATSPFLYTRLRARIAAERERREASGSWLTLLVMRRAVLAMSLVAFMSLGLLWFASSNATTTAQSFNTFSDASFFDERNAEVERVVFAERGAFSNDDVLATIVNEDQEASK
jgi:hypothetical protein